MSKKEFLITGKELVVEIKQIIEQSKQLFAVSVNAQITQLYWAIGRKLYTEVLKEQRAEYGKQIVDLLARELTEEYGKGWSVQQLRHCLRIAETFPNQEILYALIEN